MSLDELLDRLKISDKPQRAEDGSYIIDLNNSNELSRYYSRMEKLKDQEEFIELEGFHSDDSSIRIEYASFDNTLTVVLSGYYDSDEYTIIIREL